MKIRHFLQLSFMALVCTSPAESNEINWSGFMSVAGGKTLDAGTLAFVEPTTLALYDNEFRFDVESVVGLQAQTVISDKLRGTVQLVAKSNNNYDAAIDWAYLSYDLAPNLTLNAGRFRLPLYYYSDFLDVGYAYYWVRPPTEVYSVYISSLEGINLYHSAIVGDVEVATQVWYGGDQSTMASEFGTSNSDSRNNQGINTTISWEWFKVRLLYNTTDLQITSDVFEPTDVDVTFMAAAFMADYQNFIWRSEITQSDTGTEDVAWYVSAAYNIDDFTPHITHTRVHAATESFSPDAVSNTVGVAWNFDSSAVLKIEYAEKEYEYLPFPIPDTRLISIAIDVLF